MAYNECLAERVRGILTKHPTLAERRMFGGISFMLQGNFCCGVVNDDLVVRVGPESYEGALTQAATREMDFTGRPMTGWVYVAAAGLESSSALAEWVSCGVQFALSLPAK